MAQTKVEPEGSAERIVWEKLNLCIRGNQIQFLDFHALPDDKHKEPGWYIKWVRPATLQERSLWFSLIEAVKENRK